MAWILPDSVVADVASLPVAPLDGFEATVAGNPVRYDTATAKWVPTAPRRLAQLPYEALVDDVEVVVTNDRCPTGTTFVKYGDQWIDPALPLTCPDCGTSQIVETTGSGTRHVINSAADLTALKVAASIADGDVVHLRNPDGGTGATIVGYFDLRGDRVTSRANPMAGGAVGTPVKFTADPDVLMEGTATEPAVDVGEVDHVWVQNLKIKGGFQGVRYQGARGTAEQLQRVSHVDASETVSARFPFQAFTTDITEWSEFIRYDCCHAHTELVGNASPEFSEGHYGGTGSLATIGQDRTHDVYINNCTYEGLTAEAIELKPGLRRVWIDGVEASNMRFTPHGGAGVTGVFSLLVPGGVYTPLIDDAEISLTNFKVHGYDDFYAVAVGHGGVTVSDGTASGATGSAAANAAVRVRSVAPYGTNATGSTAIVVQDIRTDLATVLQVFDPEVQLPNVVDWTALPDGDPYPEATNYTPNRDLGDVGTQTPLVVAETLATLIQDLRDKGVIGQ